MSSSIEQGPQSNQGQERTAPRPAEADALRDELMRRRLAARRAGAGATGRRDAITRADRDAPLPLSYGQQQMWFLNRLDPESAEYLVPLALRLRGPLDATALRGALRDVVARHEILRTRYVLDGTAPVQVVDAAPDEFPLQSTDLAASGDTCDDSSADAREKQALEAVREEAGCPFDLERDRPLRARLIRLGADDHVLVVVFHHIAVDAWSSSLFCQELSELYLARSEDRDARLPSVEIQYADYAAWQREHLSGERLEKELAYWRAHLDGALPVDLPTDRPRPAARSAHGAEVEVPFPAGLAERVRELAARHETTPFVVLLTAFQALVARYAGQQDVSVGTVVSGRSRPELQQMIGYGINNLVMRASWDGARSFDELIAAARETVLQAYDHQAVPFAQLVDELEPERDMSRTPLYQVAFTMHEARDETPRLFGIDSEPFGASSGVAKCDLELQVVESGDGTFYARIVYATALFEQATAERLAGHCVRLLQGMAVDPAAPTSRIDILDAAELALAAASPVTTGSVERCVHEVFEAQVAATPDAVAVVFEGESLTYAQVDERANRLAHYLRARGAGPETFVGLCLERGLGLIPALLGVLKSGAAYVPLDPVNPVERLGYVASHSGLSVVVTDTASVGVVREFHTGAVVELDGADADRVAACEATSPGVSMSPDNAIYVIYTSGSTGRPKGVCLSHANVARLLDVAQEHFAFGASDAWSLFHSYAFDVSVFEMWGALLNGGRLVVVPRAVTRSPEDFLDLLVRDGVTVLSQTPSAFRSIVAAAADGDARIGQLVLRAVVFAGEKLEIPELKPWVARKSLDDVALVNMYGITETTVHTTYYRLVDGDLATDAGNAIGHPLSDLTIHLLDSYGNLVPVGVPGEIHVGGPGVARGYLNRPDLTAERFVPDPFGPAGSRLYRSGDLARRRADGSLDFLGRIDDQVKIRGYRIELGEIETVLTAQPVLRDGVVVVREDTPGDKRLVAYCVPQQQTDLDPAALRAELGRDLPDYMVPSAFVVLDTLPLTPNGKLDKRALPAPDQEAFAQGAYVAPRTPVEERMAAVWADVLGLERVGVEDSFFDLGGDSIRAVALVGALRTEGFRAAVRDVFEARTVAALAGLVGAVDAEEGTDLAFAGVDRFALISDEDRAALPADAVDAYPLSRVQTGMVVEMLSDTSRNHYHNVSTYRIRDEKPFSPAAFAEAGRVVVSRHEVLRTSIALDTYSVPMQVVHAVCEPDMSVAHLPGLTREEQHEVLRKFTVAERAHVFDFASPPLMRYSAHAADDGWWISVTECHPIMEGWSYHSLLMELLDCYMRLRDGLEPEPFDAPAVRYADFVAGELESLDDEDDRAYWRGIVADHTKFTFPAGWNDSPDVPRRTEQIGISWTHLEDRLRGLAKASDASLKSVMVAAHMKVMSLLTDEREFHTGLVCDARPEALGADRVYGMYLNTVPFPVDRTARTWRDLVRQTFDREVELWSHRRFPLPEIQREAGSSGRLLDAFFNYQDFRQVDHSLVDPLGGIDDSPTELPLTVSARGGHIILTIGVPALSLAHGERILDLYRQVLDAMAADFDGDARATFLPEGEAELLRAAASPVTAGSVERCVHEVFEAQVAATPDAVAVVFEGESLTYAQVDERANRLAHYLRARGAGPETFVGLCLERGLGLIPALLGVLKSGAAYVPLDPVNPVERLGYIAEDSGLSVVVTDRASVGVVREFHPGSVVVTDGEDAEHIADSGAMNPAVPMSPDNAIYVIYTSGSTGRPKGVCLSHANVERLLDVAQEHYAFDESDAWSLFHSYAFDVSVFEMWGALLNGGRLVVVPRAVTRSPEDFLDLLVRDGVTVLSQTPSAFRSIVAAAADGDARVGQLALRAVVFAGEKLEIPELKPWVARKSLDDVALVNMYGITETTVHTTYYRLVEEDFAPDAGNAIGHPLSDLTVQLLDTHGNLVPVGVPGEIHVGGPGVARGYLNRPDLTAERFVPDPFGPAGSRLYRSGDLARRRADGSLDFLGRIDDQVKIRGYRIELGEIETVLTAQPVLRDGVVVVREDSPGDKRLVAYCVPAPGDELELASLRSALGRDLPDYMVPSAFVVLDKLPLTPNGKLDKRALPAPDQEAFAQGAYVAPRTPVEERMAAVWADVLGLERVGVEDSFFDLGGDSIRAISLVGALRAAGFEVSIQQVFEARTIAGLGANLGGDLSAGAPGGRPAGVEPFALISDEDRADVPAMVVDAYPLSQVQTGMVAEMLVDADRNTYHGAVSHRVRDDKPFSADALRAAAAVVCARQDVLRTSFDFSTYSVPLQLVHAEGEIEIPVHVLDLRDLDETARRERQLAFFLEEPATVFDLERGPLLRIAVHLEDRAGWRLSVTQHHAITEGWSYHSLMMDLIACYRRIRDGLAPEPFDAPAVRYADFVAGETESLADERDRAYWRGIVDDHAPLTLPDSWADGGRDQEPGEYGIAVPFDGDTGERLRALASDSGTSVKSVLLAAHTKVMSLLTDEERFHTGLVCDARPEALGADRVYGMYLNTVPFAVERTARTWRELVRQTFDREVELWSHRRYPMPQMQREAGRGGQRLVDVLFNFQNFHVLDEESVDTDAGFGNGVTEFALSVGAHPGGISLQSSTARLSRGDAERIASLYRQVVSAMAADFHGDADAAFLPDGERELVIAAGRGQAVPLGAQTLHELVEAQVRRAPDAPAVVFEDESLTYAEVNERANRLAHHLRDLGVGPSTMVAVCLERSAELVVAVLAVAKAGGAFVPLDPDYPRTRLELMLDDVLPPVLLTDARLAAGLPYADGVTVLMDDAAVWAHAPAADPQPLATADDAAFVVFTSGSTGRPKGVVNTHRGPVNRLEWTQRVFFRLGADDALLQKAPAGFDVFVAEVFGALMSGARLVVARPGGHRDPAYLRALIAGQRVTMFHFVPSMLALLLADGGLADCPSVRIVTCGGEALPKALAEEVLTSLPGVELFNQYGPSEAAIDTAHWGVSGRLPDGLRQIPMGGPVQNVGLYVLDAGLRPQPMGVPGELYIGGTAVATGYVRRPALTAERFVPDPFGTAGSRLYRTGDRVRWNAAGELEYLGRVDDQVKIRGVRVEPGEIEAVLAAHPSVRDAVVLVREDTTGDKRLVAYVVPVDGTPADTTSLDTAALRADLARDLPAHLVPAAFVTLERIPLNPNGKTDKRALPAPDQDSFAQTRGAYVAPRTPAEQLVADVWCRVLGVERTGVTDSFFDLGGDSIRAVALVGALRAAGFGTSIQEVFELRTVEALCAAAADRGPAAEAFTAVAPFALIGADDRAKLPAGTVDAYPLSQGQTGMVAELIAGDTGENAGANSYHTVSVIRVRDEQPFAADALERAAALVAERHDMLRTSIHLNGYSEPLQLVHAAARVPVAVARLSGDKTADESTLRAFVAGERAHLLDLESAPLLRLAAHTADDGGWWLTFTSPHVILDGWSHNSLVMELLGAYMRLRDGLEPEPFDAPAVRYADFVAGELESLDDEDDRAYWRGVVDGHARFQLPADWADLSRTAEAYSAEVTYGDLTEGLRAAAAAADVPLKSVLLAAHVKVLSSLTVESEFHTGLVCHARPEAEGADRLIGMQLNTLPFASDRSAGTWRELAEQVFARELELWSHRRFPLPEIQREAGGGRLVDVLFNYVDFRQVDEDLVDTGLAVNDAPKELGLSVDATPTRMSLSSNTRAVGRAEADRLAAMYRLVLESIAQDVDGDARAAYLPGGERERLLGEASGGTPAVPVERCVHEVFEAQVAATPDAVAVVFEGESLTYAQVDERANRLAHYLRARGAGPETFVGLCLERGLGLIPALLGVLKSGAAYVPLDPVNPVERLGYIAEDSGLSVVVTDRASVGVVREFHTGSVVELDGADADRIAACEATSPGVSMSPDNAIYVIYTSGSTGRPKGVCLSHANVARLLDVAQEHYAFDESDAWSLFHSYAFDVSVFEMWGALLNGGRLVVVPRAVTRSPEDFLDLLVRDEVTVLSQTPSAFRSIVAAAADGDPRIKQLSLRAVIFAGEKLDVPELKPWVSRMGLGRTALVNMYGITETTVHTTYHRLVKRDLEPEAGNPIGRPLSDLSVHLLDSYGNLVPVGVPGEIHVGGPGVARGYLNRPDLTAERFVPDPFGPAGSRLYRSGDLARRRADGSLDFLGRIDDQVKIRGYRIELGEIDTVLAAQSGVRDGVVVVREDTPGDKRLVAYCVPASGADLDPAALRTELGLSLPDYMVPSAFVVLDTLPLTPNGKLDKRALPAPEQDAFAQGAYVAPRTPVEERMAAVWAQVLGLERVGVEDSFFDIGGDSIRAVALVGALRTAGLHTVIQEIFAARTVAGLCRVLAERDTDGEVSQTPAPVEPFALVPEADRALLPGGGVTDAYPLSQAQTGMVVEMMTGSGGDGPARYHNVSSLRLRGEALDLAALRRAVDAVTERHEILRTSVDLDTYSVPMQLVHEQAEVPLGATYLSGLDAAQQERLIAEFVAAEGVAAFALDRAPLLRLHVHDCRADEGWQFTVTQAHVILDGWSYHQLLNELVDLYRRFRDGTEPARRPEAPAVRFADHIAGELTALASADDRAYWSGITASYGKFTLPESWAEPADTPRETQVTQVRFADLDERLRTFAAGSGISMKSVLHAAHLRVMSLISENEAFCTGITCHTRPEADGADRVHGMYLNILPFATDRSSARTWRELARRTFDREVELWPHRRFPMPVIQRELTEEQRLIEVHFSYQDFGRPEETPVDADASLGSSSNEFSLMVIAGPGRLDVHTHTHSVGRRHAELLGAMYRAALEAMATEPDAVMDEAPLLPAADHDRLTGPLAAGPVLDAPSTALGMFEAQVGRSPGAVAVASVVGSVSYAELDAAANRVARLLSGVGVVPGSVVGVLLDRSVDLVSVLLGVWKAGGAYVPLDPSYPGERVGGMLADAGASVVVTQAASASRFGGGVFEGPVVVLEEQEAALEELSSQSLGLLPDAEEAAYVIFTSGSTGRPKGVMVPHRGLANHVAWAVEDLAPHGTGGAPLFSSVAFDLVVPNLWGPLCSGQTVTVIGQDVPLDELGKTLSAAGPFSFIKLTPAHLEVLTHQLRAEDARELAGVLVVAGEALPARLAERWVEWLGAGRVINEYGPTEASVGSTIHPVDGAVAGDVVPIGRALPNMATYVLDAGMQVVPLGAVGELYVGGRGVARGYAGRPDLTAERFVPDPFDGSGGRLYRSGDLVRMRADGAIEFLGRMDDQVKIRGYRVELGEIEARLVEHPVVRDAVAVVREDGPGGKSLVAYVVAAEGELAPSGEELAEFCGVRLPEYMVPQAFLVLDAIPLTANGKTDKRALPAPDLEAGVGAREFIAPATPTEQRLAAIWSDALELERIGAGDNFFDLGGHSILIIKVVSEARKAGLALSLYMLYQHTTLRDLAADVEAATAAETTDAETTATETTAAVATVAPAPSSSSFFDGIDMTAVPGAGVAVIEGGELVAVETYGVLASGGAAPVTEDTVFQVGSVSKHLTALAALRLAESGVLDLDANINGYLKGWQVPGVDGRPAPRITARQLLGHLSGLLPTVSKGFVPGRPVPSLEDVLHGRAPSDTPAVRPDLTPGEVFRKANVHYSVLQQAMTDVTGTPFPELMRELVLDPLHLTGSSFDQSFPEHGGHPVALGHDAESATVEGGRRVRPDMAAAGLWSTAADLAKVALEVRRSWLGRPQAFLDRDSAQQLLTPHEGTFYGLGTVVDTTGSELQFGHGGEPTGYQALMMTRARSGDGVVVLTNGDGGKDVVKAVADSVRNAR